MHNFMAEREERREKGGGWGIKPRNKSDVDLDPPYTYKQQNQS